MTDLFVQIFFKHIPDPTLFLQRLFLIEKAPPPDVMRENISDEALLNIINALRNGDQSLQLRALKKLATLILINSDIFDNILECGVVLDVVRIAVTKQYDEIYKSCIDILNLLAHRLSRAALVHPITDVMKPIYNLMRSPDLLMRMSTIRTQIYMFAHSSYYRDSLIESDFFRSWPHLLSSPNTPADIKGGLMELMVLLVRHSSFPLKSLSFVRPSLAALANSTFNTEDDFIELEGSNTDVMRIQQERQDKEMLAKEVLQTMEVLSRPDDLYVPPPNTSPASPSLIHEQARNAFQWMQSNDGTGKLVPRPPPPLSAKRASASQVVFSVRPRSKAMKFSRLMTGPSKNEKFVPVSLTPPPSIANTQPPISSLSPLSIHHISLPLRQTPAPLQHPISQLGLRITSAEGADDFNPLLPNAPVKKYLDEGKIRNEPPKVKQEMLQDIDPLRLRLAFDARRFMESPTPIPPGYRVKKDDAQNSPDTGDGYTIVNNADESDIPGQSLLLPLSSASSSSSPSSGFTSFPNKTSFSSSVPFVPLSTSSMLSSNLLHSTDSSSTQLFPADSAKGPCESDTVTIDFSFELPYPYSSDPYSVSIKGRTITALRNTLLVVSLSPIITEGIWEMEFRQIAPSSIMCYGIVDADYPIPPQYRVGRDFCSAGSYASQGYFRHNGAWIRGNKPWDEKTKQSVIVSMEPLDKDDCDTTAESDTLFGDVKPKKSTARSTAIFFHDGICQINYLSGLPKRIRFCFGLFDKHSSVNCILKCHSPAYANTMRNLITSDKKPHVWIY
ncbi:uncharacterized protein MONOS_629 [Monocercomonoides exilis]|uniref:uncharacterized protein n=1 Tax=Monocercomonoides exilis TaxID=2049356 RepID=UPI00355AB2DD|nr:hypothetical protein MONOS_629 [Monocercomonoides exilis]|eukprot:MONOS_629.2-p1 / transcript=MONOS_629.2 / gene=MONOS_629 / organism=Monocercomonoides_exilis_PA203 / gene_product=unspecified product / transcript_product=unspecified product / location=Mono_scaffold00010:89492-92839(-) / protein_length=785 / sequence_SO=supercontig / SO=protein_coding / is_pseudo=false